MQNSSKRSRILITGAAGFIGAAVTKRLCEDNNFDIVGLDNLNDYYDPSLKMARLASLGIFNNQHNGAPTSIESWQTFPKKTFISSTTLPYFRFIRIDLQDDKALDTLFRQEQFEYVIHLGAQAGVRYSIENPRSYIESNIDGFLNILEGCRHTKVKHLIYASSSSVYGLNDKTPFSESDSIAHPVSLYAATKKSNELMAHAYSQLYLLPTTGLRFFTVYGPWGRPDMSPYLFIDAIMNGREIKVFNNGNMWRDFTYIEDIVESILRLIDKIPCGNKEWDPKHPDPSTSSAPYRIFNIGNSHPVNLKEYISIIEEITGHKANKILMPMQPGDVYRTYSDSSALQKLTGFKPHTSLKEGIKQTVNWYKNYKKI